MRYSKPERTTKVTGTIKKETANAILLVFKEDKVFENRSVWWPLSHVKAMSHLADSDVLTVTQWIFDRKLEEFGIETPEQETPINEDDLF